MNHNTFSLSRLENRSFVNHIVLLLLIYSRSKCKTSLMLSCIFSVQLSHPKQEMSHWIPSSSPHHFSVGGIEKAASLLGVDSSWPCPNRVLQLLFTSPWLTPWGDFNYSVSWILSGKACGDPSGGLNEWREGKWGTQRFEVVWVSSNKSEMSESENPPYSCYGYKDCNVAPYSGSIEITLYLLQHFSTIT